MPPDPLRASQRACALALLLLAVGCAPGPGAGDGAAAGPAASPDVTPGEVRSELYALADDSMRGRLTGTPGAERAARWIAARMREAGLRPAGDDGYLQRIPLAWGDWRGRRVPVPLDGFAALDTLPPERRDSSANVVGLIPGSDPALRGRALVIAAHYDHLGVGTPVDGDSIYNGADDDASGVVAVLQIAQALAAGPAPKRTVVFMATTGEEVGLLGTRWYLAHPVVPLDSTDAELEIEMIGRPDSLAGGPGRAWLTGYERSTVGDVLAAAGLPIVPDPRPDQHFFQRSDNVAFALRGIPAHTLSTFNLHADYHRPSDEPDRVDYDHMARVIRAAIRAARLLADGAAPTWHENGRPSPRPRG